MIRFEHKFYPDSKEGEIRGKIIEKAYRYPCKKIISLYWKKPKRNADGSIRHTLRVSMNLGSTYRMVWKKSYSVIKEEELT